MNDIHHKLEENLTAPHQHEDSVVKIVLLQRHQAFLANVDRITIVNRTLCLAGLVSGALMLAILNITTACIFYAGVVMLGLLWRVELNLATFRLQKLEEALVRAGGGEWEDKYIRAKGEVAGDEFHRFILWMEPIVWMIVAALLLVGNIAVAGVKIKAEKEKNTAVIWGKRGHPGFLSATADKNPGCPRFPKLQGLGSTMTHQPSLKIIVEGVTDAQLIRAILGDDRAKKARFYAGQGRTSLASLGRNILFHEGGPILLVMDSDTLNPRLTAELESLKLAAMSGPITSGIQLPAMTASGKPLLKVFSFVPEIEAVFFESPEALERLLGTKSPQEKVKEGHFIPRQVLTELLANGKAQRDYQVLLEQIDPQLQQAIASGQQASNLKAVVESLLADAA